MVVFVFIGLLFGMLISIDDKDDDNSYKFQMKIKV